MWQFITSIFNLLLSQPLFNALILIYQYLPVKDFGLAVIVLTFLTRIILYPLMSKSIRAQKALNELQPKIQEIQQKYKNNREKQAVETINLYKKEKINPFSTLLPVLIQLPLLLALFWVFMSFKDGLDPEQLSVLYSFVPTNGLLEEPMFLGLINLAQPSWFLAVFAGICQFFQGKMVVPKSKKQKNPDQMAKISEMMQKQMLYVLPFFMSFILLRMPAAIGLYWIATSLFSIGQQYITLKKPAYAQPKQS